MEIKIENSTVIEDIKQQFNEKFPFLKLEFFNQLDNDTEDFSRKNLITKEHKILGEIYDVQHSGVIHISEEQTVAALEQTFKLHFGIQVQVFRKSGSNWLETTNSDSWTLADQNRKGEELSIPFRAEHEEEDMHEQP